MMLEKCSEVRAPPCSRMSPPCSEFWPLSTSNLFPEESVMRERIWVEEEESRKSDEGNCSVKILLSGDAKVLGWFLEYFWHKVSTLGHIITRYVRFDWIWMLFSLRAVLKFSPGDHNMVAKLFLFVCSHGLYHPGNGPHAHLDQGGNRPSTCTQKNRLFLYT